MLGFDISASQWGHNHNSVSVYFSTYSPKEVKDIDTTGKSTDSLPNLTECMRIINADYAETVFLIINLNGVYLQANFTLMAYCTNLTCRISSFD